LDDLTAVFDLVVGEISDAFERGSLSLLSRPVAIDRSPNRSPIGRAFIVYGHCCRCWLQRSSFALFSKNDS
jgi:hypothetical protein